MTESGITTSVNELRLKAAEPIVVTESGIDTLLTSALDLNCSSGISVDSLLIFRCPVAGLKSKSKVIAFQVLSKL